MNVMMIISRAARSTFRIPLFAAAAMLSLLPPVVRAQETESAPVPAPATPPASDQQEVTIEPVTFDVKPGKLYVPVMEAAAIFGWPVVCDRATKDILVNGTALKKEECRRLLDGTGLVSTEGLADLGVEVNIHPSGKSATLTFESKHFTLMRADKRVEVSLAEQRLRAWQGNRLVLQTNVSTGRNGRTPSGEFSAGPYKPQLHRSRLYHNAPMPWSVQINGHVFIHGFSSVPSYPASHGCVRMPLTGGNPARFFYEWVDAGTPVKVIPVPKKTSVADSSKSSKKRKS